MAKLPPFDTDPHMPPLTDPNDLNRIAVQGLASRVSAMEIKLQRIEDQIYALTQSVNQLYVLIKR